MNVNPDVDRMVADAVRNVRDRFGTDGLRDLVNLATSELRRAEQAAEQLRAGQQDHADMGDTQAWMAFTGEDNTR
ncbi:MAG TPA: hypothetical protein VK925_12180 [Jiangellaceae bacterium]|nr:hypothetical protein [Jiangellaceae bacterium]